jgi:hypothetical protein
MIDRIYQSADGLGLGCRNHNDVIAKQFFWQIYFVGAIFMDLEKSDLLQESHIWLVYHHTFRTELFVQGESVEQI